MNEAAKTLRNWPATRLAYLRGRGIDIGCGQYPAVSNAVGFDLGEGDANHITQHVHETFDFVFSSHCLEHMRDPRQALLEWWSLVKPGGYMIILVPDEDLYEQGIFPSRFNADHKCTFTLAKQSSWSPASISLLPLALALPSAELLTLELNDTGYDRSIILHGRASLPWRVLRSIVGKLLSWLPTNGQSAHWLMRAAQRIPPIDQTLRENVLAQIELIVKKGG